MYDRPEVTQANDAFWTATQHALGFGPAHLTRDMDIWAIWQNPELLLAQTCGYPFRARLYGHVTLIGTPDYGLPDCAPGYYNSVFIARADDTRRDLTEFTTATFAYNEPMSQSGWAAPMSHMATQNLTFASSVRSGGHIKSAQMVAENGADIAAIDAVTWAMIEKYDDFAKDLRVIARTTPTPGLPLISALGADKTNLFSALNNAISALPNQTRDTLQIKAMVDIPAALYLEIPTPDGPGPKMS